MKRVCIDLDGVICTLKQPHETYADVQLMEGAAEKIKSLRDSGHYIIIQTARHMKTCNGNVGQVVTRVGAITLKWLADNNVVYDEIYFGKPWAQIYIDDNALRFKDWNSISDDGSSFPEYAENAVKKSNSEL